jgi:hypothetical protein
MNETVIYNGTRSISALVDREPPSDYGNALSPSILISVLNDDTDGISSAEIDTGSDTITIEERPGNGNAVARSISAIIEDDPIGLVLEIR